MKIMGIDKVSKFLENGVSKFTKHEVNMDISRSST